MNRELRHLKKWLEANQLSLNIEKTNFVVFHYPAKKLTEPTILKFGRKKITRANHVKCLDVLLDESLSWRSRPVNYPKSLPDQLHILQLISIYYCFVLSFLDIRYCCLGCNIKHL